MPFYLRKSVSAGPFRFNFSKGGMGVSVGVKGFRVGTGPRGHYVHAGRGGIYYRASLNGRTKSKPGIANTETWRDETPPVASNVEMKDIDSGSVLGMRDESLGSLLDEINVKHKQYRLSKVLSVAAGSAGLLLGLWLGGFWFLSVLAAVPGYYFGKWIDTFRRTTVMFYDLDGAAETLYRELTDGFDLMLACGGKWHVESAGDVRDWDTWKKNAGASRIVQKSPTTLTYQLPAVISSNVTPPAIKVGKQTLYFFPDALFVEDDAKYGAIKYADLGVHRVATRFIEEEKVPYDANIVDYTWKYVNKNGGPDRRFKDNRELPVCLYEAIHFTSRSGLNELIEFSRAESGVKFTNAIQRLRSDIPQSVPA